MFFSSRGAPVAAHVSTRRRDLCALMTAGAAALAMGATREARAQGGTPLRLLVGFPAGAGTDAIARALGEKLKDVLGVPVIVDNRAGAGGQLAAQILKASPADGHTLMLSHDHTISILPQVVRNPGFNPAVDFVPVAGFATFANVLAVSGGTPVRSLDEYIAWVKNRRAGRDTIGIPAPASIPEFMVKMIAERYRLDIQSAPYRGSAPMMADMLGNQISAGIASVPDFIENHRAGKLRIVATLGAQRQPLLPQVPTFAELGFANLDDLPYYGVFAPTGTPQAAVDRFDAALEKVLAMPDLRQKLVAMGLTVGYETQGQFAGRVRTYTQGWERIIQRSGFKPL